MKTTKKSIKSLNGLSVLSSIHTFNLKGGNMVAFSELSDEEKKRGKEHRYQPSNGK